MAPREDEVDEETSEEREQFLKDLAEYHEKRGYDCASIHHATND
jgi:hypothetical protein